MARSRPADPDDVQLTFLEHLEELRKRLVYGALAVAIAAGAGFAFAGPIFHWLMVPVIEALPDGQQTLVYTSATEKFFVYMRVAIYAGIFLSAPVLLYQVWRFVAPGLYPREKRMIVPVVLFGSIMFVGGGAFCYFIVLPNALSFLIEFGGAADWTTPMLTMREQLSLVLMLELAFGVIFEIPLIIAALSYVGLVDAAGLRKYRRHAIVVSAIAAAILTPTGDPFNLALMAVPMMLFYELGIVLAWIIGSRRAERERLISETRADPET